MDNNKVFNSSTAKLKKLDNEEIDIYSPIELDYPIIERTNNALLWPEEIKGGIDLNDTDNVTEVPLSPYTPLK